MFPDAAGNGADVRWKDAWTPKLGEIKLRRADTVAQISRGQKSAEFILVDASQQCQPQFTAEIFNVFPHLDSGGLVAIVTATFAPVPSHCCKNLFP